MWLSSFQILPTNRTKINKPRWFPPLTWGKSWILMIAEKIVGSRLETLLKCISTGKKIRSFQSIGSWWAKTTSKTTNMSIDNEALRFYNHFSIIPSPYACKMCSISILLLNCNPYFRDNKKKSEIRRHVLTSSTLGHSTSFHVVERTRTATKCKAVDKSTCKACETTVFHYSKYRLVTFTSPSASYRCLSSLMRQLCAFFSLSHIFRNTFSFESITRISGNILCERVISFWLVCDGSTTTKKLSHITERGGWIEVCKSADPLKLMAESVDPLKKST